MSYPLARLVAFDYKVIGNHVLLYSFGGGADPKAWIGSM
jgi:hypothetical protein